MIVRTGGLTAPLNLDFWGYLWQNHVNMSTTSDVEYGKLLRRKRSAVLLTTEEVSKLLGIPAVDISEIEEGTHFLTLDVRELIERFLWAKGNGLTQETRETTSTMA